MTPDNNRGMILGNISARCSPEAIVQFWEFLIEGREQFDGVPDSFMSYIPVHGMKNVRMSLWKFSGSMPFRTCASGFNQGVGVGSR
jgi:hypothetical protein